MDITNLIKVTTYISTACSVAIVGTAVYCAKQENKLNQTLAEGNKQIAEGNRMMAEFISSIK